MHIYRYYFAMQVIKILERSLSLVYIFVVKSLTKWIHSQVIHGKFLSQIFEIFSENLLKKKQEKIHCCQSI